MKVALGPLIVITHLSLSGNSVQPIAPILGLKTACSKLEHRADLYDKKQENGGAGRVQAILA